MSFLSLISKYLGPLGWPLLLLSIITSFLVFYVFYRKVMKQEISEWVEICLCHFREFAVMLGLMGSIYAIMHAFAIEGASNEQLREQMLSILSTGLWSTFSGCIVAMKASLGLIALKRT